MSDAGPEYAVQVAAYAALNQVPGLVAVYDYVPADGSVAAPFGAIGAIVSTPVVLRCGKAWQVTLRFHLYSKAAGREEAWTRLQALRAALDGEKPTMGAPYIAQSRFLEQRAGDSNDRLIKLAHTFVDFTITVSRPTP
jgi:hypothetical protein